MEEGLAKLSCDQELLLGLTNTRESLWGINAHGTNYIWCQGPNWSWLHAKQVIEFAVLSLWSLYNLPSYIPLLT